ncbi:hypothetical protein BURMUCGD1_2047 [Burkholderia multivorans CGD1]|nr:hypothetical protein BURMUCGD1_2047 [Burkholderia multivorans CGD1]
MHGVIPDDAYRVERPLYLYGEAIRYKPANLFVQVSALGV